MTEPTKDAISSQMHLSLYGKLALLDLNGEKDDMPLNNEVLLICRIPENLNCASGQSLAKWMPFPNDCSTPGS